MPRAALVGLVGFAAIAFLYPEARIAALVSAVSVVVALLLRRRNHVLSERAAGAARRTGLWPQAGVRAVVEAMTEPAFLTDRELTLRFRNSACARVFGDSALGDPIALRFRSPDLLAAAQGAVSEAAAAKAEYGERTPLDRSWSVDILPIREAGGEQPSLFLFLFRDRTAERRIERMRTDFVANASHELRTPLASLIGFIETLQGPARGDERARTRFLDIMHEQARRMSRLIDDLLSLSRIETKPALGVGDTADLAEIVRNVGETLLPLAEAQGVRIEFDDPGEAALRVAGDRDELTQVFSNLIENGCKYAASGGRLVVGVQMTADGLVEASVRDFGPGIASRHVPRLTERFYRADEGASPTTRGTGLGLSIVRNILARHGSRLVVLSKVGEGSTFSFRLRPAASTTDVGK